MRTNDGGSLNMEGSSKEGRKTSKELIAEESRLLVHNADSLINKNREKTVPCDGLCIYTSPSEDGQMYKSSCTLVYWSVK